MEMEEGGDKDRRFRQSRRRLRSEENGGFKVSVDEPGFAGDENRRRRSFQRTPSPATRSMEKKFEVQGGFGFFLSGPTVGAVTLGRRCTVPSLSGDEVQNRGGGAELAGDFEEQDDSEKKTSQDIRRKLGFGKSQRISVRVSGKGSPSPAMKAAPLVVVLIGSCRGACPEKTREIFAQ
ncbi:hypothetical protein U1Q18_045514 [Sarracenia purpurea var. burkii]